ncbi:hypothetical protein SAMN05880556_103444 [Azospirillum sp. RU38E]|nr:hypothetical protein SAMN05880556_103444 [Azospirillum sp. RU38E]SNS49927.1 hypothetical protein SAMN05880591_103444 [Azospirillum sp. RU37A]
MATTCFNEAPAFRPGKGDIQPFEQDNDFDTLQ